MYVLDTNVFYILGHYFPSRFPTIWNFLNLQAKNERISLIFPQFSGHTEKFDIISSLEVSYERTERS
jgi:hypothetical protein